MVDRRDIFTAPVVKILLDTIMNKLVDENCERIFSKRRMT